MAKRIPEAQGSGGAVDEADHIDDADLMTIEELSERSGIAPRTIRFYQGEKLLQKPERDRSDGRVARYGPAHLERLRLVGELREIGEPLTDELPGEPRKQQELFADFILKVIDGLWLLRE